MESYIQSYYQQILLHSTVYNNEVDKFMDKRFRILYLHKIAFNLIPQRLSCTKAKNIRESRKRNMILISLPSCRMCCTIMVHFIGVPLIVTGQCLFNVPDVTLVPNFGRILVASLSNVNVASCYGAIIGVLWIIGCSLQGTVLNMFSSVFNVVKYNSDIVL